MGIKIIGTGKYLPEKVITNEDISQHVDTSHEWILDRTGIEQRRIATTESSLDMAAAAAEQALQGIDKDSIGLVVVATITPDNITPSMAAMVKKELGLERAIAFDINAACSGFVYGLWIAESLMNTALSQYSKDGAGAAVLESDENERGILSTYIKNYDDVKGAIKCKANYINPPFWEDDLTPQPLFMKGRAVFKFAVNAIDEVTKGALEETGLTCDDVDWFVLHQANGRIIQAAAQKLGQPIEKFQISIQDGGNVSSATVPMALYDLNLTQKMKKGDIIALVGFGGGLCAAAAIIEW